MKAKIQAEPYAFEFDYDATAVIFIDMQKDFISHGGFGESLGNDVARLQTAIGPCVTLLNWARSNNLLVIHTREGHLANMSNVFANKLHRGQPPKRIGDDGPMGKILIRGAKGHDFVEELRARDGEVVIEKAGKGAF